MEKTIRVANQADIEAIFAIRTSVRENHLSLEQLTEMGITPDAICQAMEAAPCIWVAEVNGVAVGFAMADAEDGCVFAAFVRAEFEGLGLGTVLWPGPRSFCFSITPRFGWRPLKTAVPAVFIGPLAGRR